MDDIQKIKIGDAKIGLTGLAEIFKEVKQSHISDERILRRVILEGVKRQNYVPTSKEQVYEEALLREYKKFLGEPVPEERLAGLEVKILGPGCRACDKLLADTKTVLAELGLAAAVEHITDLEEIGRYGMLVTPALIINGEVKSAGKIPAKEQIKKMLQEA
jgi:small redox-active disulfide protein 2